MQSTPPSSGAHLSLGHTEPAHQRPDSLRAPARDCSGQHCPESGLRTDRPWPPREASSRRLPEEACRLGVTPACKLAVQPQMVV